MKKFKIGERVRVFHGYNTIDGVVIAAEINRIHIKNDANQPVGWFHPKQCRHLKPKSKSVRVTKEMLAKAWDDVDAGCNSKISGNFAALIKVLGL